MTTTDIIACLKCYSVLVANNQQCPFQEIQRQRLSCDSSFPSEFYKDSIDEICQYVCFLSALFVSLLGMHVLLVLILVLLKYCYSFEINYLMVY